MRLIVITPEDILENEAEMVTAMLRRNVDRVHLRHPGCGRDEMAGILQRIAPDIRRRITIHDHYELHTEFPGIGVHLNRRNPKPPEGFGGMVSRSCHSTEEVQQWAPRCAYVTLSPIFDSISKGGYCAGGFTETGLSALPPEKVIALGGITAERINSLRRYPFAGYAVSGDIWLSPDPIKQLENYDNSF